MTLYAEDKQHALFGSRLFEDPRNADKIFVHSMGQAFLSSTYRTSAGPASYHADFALSIEPVAAGASRISVESLEPHAFVGHEFNAHAMGFVPASVPVSPSSADQYRLLAYIAHAMGASIQPLEAPRPGHD